MGGGDSGHGDANANQQPDGPAGPRVDSGNSWSTAWLGAGPSSCGDSKCYVLSDDKPECYRFDQVTGNNQTAAMGQNFAPLSLRVLDAQGRPVVAPPSHSR